MRVNSEYQKLEPILERIKEAKTNSNQDDLKKAIEDYKIVVANINTLQARASKIWQALELDPMNEVLQKEYAEITNSPTPSQIQEIIQRAKAYTPEQLKEIFS